jgi:translation initiation factor IF-2
VSFDAKRTQVAQGAYDFARYFTSTFANARFGRAVPRRAELQAPEGMSTGGGRAARQSIVLIADTSSGQAGPGGGPPTLTVGWVEVSARRAQIRTHRALAAVHRARFRDRLLDIDEESYTAFLNQTVELLASCGVGVAMDDDTSGAVSQRSSTRPPPRQENYVLNYFAVGFVAFVLGAFAGGLAVYARFVGF